MLEEIEILRIFIPKYLSTFCHIGPNQFICSSVQIVQLVVGRYSYSGP